MARKLELGGHGEIKTSLQRRGEDGKWKNVTGSKRKGDMYRARAWYRDWENNEKEISRQRERVGDAIEAVKDCLADVLHANADLSLTPSSPLVSVGDAWVKHIERNDKGLAQSTIDQYTGNYKTYVKNDESKLNSLNLKQANNPAILRRFLQGIADDRGNGAMKVARKIVSGILAYAVNSGLLEMNAMKQVNTVRSLSPKVSVRDTERSFTVDEANALLTYVDEQASLPGGAPRTQRMRRDLADIVHFMMGTGTRLGEARLSRWEHFNLDGAYCVIMESKTKAGIRRLDFPDWLAVRVRTRAEIVGTDGYVFASPAVGLEGRTKAERNKGFVADRETEWNRRNATRVYRNALDAVGLDWATSHTVRKTVGRRLALAGEYDRSIADQLGHKDVRVTQAYYMTPDFGGDKSAMAKHL